MALLREWSRTRGGAPRDGGVAIGLSPADGESSAVAAVLKATPEMELRSRERLTRIVDPLILLVGVPAVAVFATLGFSRDSATPMLVVYAVFAMAGAALATVGRRMPGSLRGKAYAFWLFGFAVSALGYFGPLLGTGAFFVGAAVAAAVFTGRGGVLAVTFGVAPAVALGSLSAPIVLTVEQWIRMAIATGTAMAATGFFIAYLLEQSASARAELAVALERERSERTARERVQADLNRAQRVEAIGRLASGVAHDVNNALQVVMGNAQLMRLDETLPAATLEMVDDVAAAASSAQATMGQLMLFDRERVIAGATEVVPVVERVLRSFERLLPANVKLNARLETQGRVALHEAQLEHVILNLLMNARDALPDGGEVEVAVTGAGTGWIAIDVRDNGVGMAPEVLERAFEPFFTTKAEGKGTGLGLASVFAAAHAVGGQVDASSAEGAGTVVRVELPRAGSRVVPRPGLGDGDGSLG